MAEARDSGLVHPEYWVDICANGIDPFLSTPRDVVRLVNAVSATYPAVKGEVNPIDFTALETLRLFSPLAYDAVRQRPAAFLLPPHARRDEDGSLAATKRYHERWMDAARRGAERARLQPADAAVPAAGRRARARGCWRPCPRTRGGRCC